MRRGQENVWVFFHFPATTINSFFSSPPSVWKVRPSLQTQEPAEAPPPTEARRSHQHQGSVPPDPCDRQRQHLLSLTACRSSCGQQVIFDCIVFFYLYFFFCQQNIFSLTILYLMPVASRRFLFGVLKIVQGGALGCVNAEQEECTFFKMWISALVSGENVSIEGGSTISSPLRIPVTVPLQTQFKIKFFSGNAVLRTVLWFSLG